MKSMIQEFDKDYVEKLLCELDKHNCLFPQFELTKNNNKLKFLGNGGFSVVYEMHNKERKENFFALKVIGFQGRKVSSTEFWNTSHIQWILSQDSKYIMRVLDARELVLVFDDNGVVIEVKDAEKEVWEETEKILYLQFVLTEKLEEVIEKDRFAKVKLIKDGMSKETEVLKLAFEIGQALAVAHTNMCLHRDIKLENIFWDSFEQVYKLGDFGIAKWTEDGNAETIVYTDGYGAPEIERRLYDNYNATADIYSFGMVLYLLLNDLKFPGSDGYYSMVELQYNPEFVFPAPIHASVEMTRVIRKMCAFYSEERYQSMNEVLADLAKVHDLIENKVKDELIEIADIATETFREEKTNESEVKTLKQRQMTRAERKEEQRIVDILYREDSIKYFFVITVLLILLLKGVQSDDSFITNGIFFMLPAAVLIDVLLQRLKEFHLMYGTIILVISSISIYSVGLTVPHIILILCVLICCPVLTLAGSVSTGLWMFLEYTDKLNFLDYIYKWDLGWIILIAVLLVVNRYFQMRIEWNKTTYTRALLGVFIYDKLFPVMTLTGIVLYVLQRCGMIEIPSTVEKMHLIRTGIISFYFMTQFVLGDSLPWEISVTDEGDRLANDDKLLEEGRY